MESNIIRPGELVLPPSMQFKETAGIGPFKTGARIPLCGLVMQIIGVQANENMDFKVTMIPVGVTAGAVKRVNGKKGKKNAKRHKRYSVPASTGA